jgi:hypothetical protein
MTVESFVRAHKADLGGPRDSTAASIVKNRCSPLPKKKRQSMPSRPPTQILMRDQIRCQL